MKTGPKPKPVWERLAPRLVVEFSTPKVNGFHCLRCVGMNTEGYPTVRNRPDPEKVFVKDVVCEMVGRPRVVYGLHHCDNRWCVEPEHIYDGSKADNNADTRNRGRVGRADDGRFVSVL